MSTVTDNVLLPREIRVIRNAFTTLAGFALDEHDPADGRYRRCALCGASAWVGRHCLTCHTDAHLSCFGCGACLPLRASRGRRYCSTTCRVRAHNYYHHTTEGRTRLLQDQARSAAFWSATAPWPKASDERMRARRSRATGAVCGRCGHEFAEGEQRFRGRVWRATYVMCEPCAPKHKGWDEARPCEGCGCPVRESWQTRRYHRQGFTRRVTCSHRCDLTGMHRRQKEQRGAERQPVDCQVCGERVDSRRRDARYCSNACRQKAHRGRRPAEAVA